jgi:molecular chaperone DnaK
MQVLRNECDLRKIELTEKTETKLTCRHNGKTINLPLTREKFDQLTADLLQRTSDTVQLVLEQAKMSPKELDAVVLVGGSTIMPQVRQMMTGVMGREPYTGLNPYVSVALGAAIHAAILEAQNRPESGMGDKVRKMLSAVKQENVNSHGLGIVIKDPVTGKKRNHVMIPKNTRLPVSTTQVFQTVQENQRRMNVQVMEGDAPDPEACSMLGNCRIFGLPDVLAKGAPVEVTYAFDTAGRISVTARDKTGGKEASIDIQRKGTLTEDQVDGYARLAADYKVE